MADLRVNNLKHGNRKRRSLTGTGLGLRNSVAAADDLSDGAALDGTGSLETIGVDTAEKVIFCG
jgi:hypothetical protein